MSAWISRTLLFTWSHVWAQNQRACPFLPGHVEEAESSHLGSNFRREGQKSNSASQACRAAEGLCTHRPCFKPGSRCLRREGGELPGLHPRPPSTASIHGLHPRPCSSTDRQAARQGSRTNRGDIYALLKWGRGEESKLWTFFVSLCLLKVLIPWCSYSRTYKIQKF